MLGRSGLYARVSTDKNGYAHFFLLFKGNDLHSGTSPTVQETELEPFLAELRMLFKTVGLENCVLYVLYPTLLAFWHEAGVSMTQPTGFERPGTSHTFADDGFPACGTSNK